MKTIITILIDLMQKQGASFLLLFAGAYYFHLQNVELNKKVDACNSAIIEVYRTESFQNREVIRANTEALKNFSYYLSQR